MRLEDCTKEELIYLLRKNHCYSFVRTEQLEIDVLLYRSDRCLEREAESQKKSAQAYQRFVDVMSPYNGQSIANIPDKVYRKARAALNEHKKHEKAYQRDSSRWNKIQVRLGELLGIK